LKYNMTSELEHFSEKINPIIENSLLTEGKSKTLYAAARHLLGAGGKRLRPLLVFKSCELVGGREEDALRVAASVELFHNFTLIHDDIMDRDDKRRGISTVHIRYGEPLAITAGDLLFAKLYEVVLMGEAKPERTLEILKKLTDAAVRVCEGQALDMEFEDKPTVTEEEYLEMVAGKTAALFKASAQAGAIAGGGNKQEVNLLGAYAFQAGIAFQIIDDILGITAETGSLGKPVGSDLREGKKTLIIAHALAKANETERRTILKVLKNKNANQDEIKEVIELLKSLGSVGYARNLARTYISRAKESLSSFRDSPEKDFLEVLLDFFVERGK
jgi:geranylgeranyl diphosphate synthase, type I